MENEISTTVSHHRLFIFDFNLVSNRYASLLVSLPCSITDWHQLYRRRTECISQCHSSLDALADRYVRDIGFGNRQLFMHYSDIERYFTEQHWFDSTLTIDVLHHIINDELAQNEQRNMTQCYYARHVLDYIVRFVRTRPHIEQWMNSADRDLLDGKHDLITLTLFFKVHYYFRNGFVLIRTSTDHQSTSMLQN